MFITGTESAGAMEKSAKAKAMSGRKSSFLRYSLSDSQRSPAAAASARAL